MKKRQANIEMLRCIAMMMVVMLHYLSKGGFLAPLTGELDINHYVAWGMEAFAIVAVNVYVLISGYFLVDSTFSLKKIIRLWLQVFFYSLSLPAILILISLFLPETEKLLVLSELNLYQLLQYGFPLLMEHYWFISAYLVMYLFFPFLALGMKSMSKDMLQKMIFLLLLVLSVAKTVLPVKLSMDSLGYDSIWFMCVFLVAGYIKLYGIPFFNSAGKSFFCFLVSSGLTFGMTVLLRAVYLATGKIGDFIQSAYSYNHVLNLFGAVALFYTFYYLKIEGEKGMGKISLWAGPYTLGVYLLHEHLEIRWRWPTWLGACPQDPVLLFVGKSLLSVFFVFGIGVGVDYLRVWLFERMEKLCRKK